MEWMKKVPGREGSKAVRTRPRPVAASRAKKMAWSSRSAWRRVLSAQKASSRAASFSQVDPNESGSVLRARRRRSRNSEVSVVQMRRMVTTVGRENKVGLTMNARVLALVLQIIGGAPSSQSAVVCITADTLPVCSGTFIGAKSVLTAGHCAWVLGQSVPYQVNVGPDCAHPQRRAKVTDMVTHPQYAGEGKPFDVAMVSVDMELDAGTFALLDGGVDASLVGTTIRHIGYGTSQESPMDGWGLQRAVSHAVTSVDESFLWSGDATANTCNGDSGGPMVNAAGELIGVVSDGPDCHSASADVRVDTVREWVEQKLLEWEPPAPPEHHGCTAGASGPWLVAVLAWLSRRRSPKRLGRFFSRAQREW
jgi:uncharacterized protein (TIGR03382 family)